MDDQRDDREGSTARPPLPTQTVQEPELLTERLLLRPPAETDAEQVFARYSADPDVCRYLSWRPHRCVDDTANFLRGRIADHTKGQRYSFLIFTRDRAELLGSIGGMLEGHCLQFGYCLARDAWGRGFAAEAASAFIAAAFENPAVLRLQAYCDVENPRSARVLEKAGLRYEGRLRCYVVLPNMGDVPRDVLLYAITRADLNARASHTVT
jgi:ribosomal-protein-alanine N-acetyltransferase